MLARHHRRVLRHEYRVRHRQIILQQPQGLEYLLSVPRVLQLARLLLLQGLVRSKDYGTYYLLLLRLDRETDTCTWR